MGRAKGTMRPKERNEGDGGIGEAGCANGDEKSTMEYLAELNAEDRASLGGAIGAECY